MVDQLSPELRELKDRMKSFINDVVIPAEPVLMQEGTPEAQAKAEELKQAGKDAGLWALGHPHPRSAAAGCRSWTSCTSTR